jgi:hypothetical protein
MILAALRRGYRGFGQGACEQEQIKAVASLRNQHCRMPERRLPCALPCEANSSNPALENERNDLRSAEGAGRT